MYEPVEKGVKSLFLLQIIFARLWDYVHEFGAVLSYPDRRGSIPATTSQFPVEPGKFPDRADREFGDKPRSSFNEYERN